MPHQYSVILSFRYINLHSLILCFTFTDLDQKCVILGGKVYIVGRRDCDILLPGDQTVSRKHAELSVSHTEANLVSMDFLA